jgi:hypothetical protein
MTSLLLEIHIDSGLNTKCGDCPVSVWDNFEQANLCNISEKECSGALNSRPDFCPLREEIIPSLH